MTTQEATDRWFTRRGVPTFSETQSLWNPRTLLPSLLAPLLVVAAAQLATAPLVHLDTWHIALGPVVVTLVALPLLPSLRWVLDPQGDRPSPRAGPLLIAAVGGAGVFAVLLATSEDDQVVFEAATNIGVLLTALVVCTILLRPEVWVHDKERRDLRQWSLFGLLVAGVVAFALEGMPVAPLDAKSLGLLPESAPPALLAVPLVALLWFVAGLMSRNAPAATLARPWPANRREALLSVSPLLVLLFSMETTLLPRTSEPWVAALLPLGVLALAVGLSQYWPWDWSWYRAATRETGGEAVSDGVVLSAGVAVLVYLLAYPLLADLIEQEQFEVALAVNAAYVVVAVLVVVSGVDRLAVWASQKLETNYREILIGVLRGLPLLLVFTAFFLFTTEIWQAAEAMPDWAYWTLVGLFVGITALFLLLVAVVDVKRHCEFDDWPDVRSAALRLPADRPIDVEIRDLFTELGGKLGIASVDAGTAGSAGERDVRPPDDPGEGTATPDEGNGDLKALLTEAKLFEEQQADRCTDPLPAVRLSSWQRLNVLGVVGVYQAFIFVPLFAAAFGVLLGVGLLAVRNPLLDNWINGDRAPGDRRPVENFFDEGFFTWPWTRVALFLAAFSILYVAVDVLRSAEQRAQFFAGADEGVRQRLAVRKVYERQRKRWERDRQRREPSGPSARSTGRFRRRGARRARI